jgi:hypothetical protein
MSLGVIGVTVTVAITPLLFYDVWSIDRSCLERAGHEFRGYCKCHRNSDNVGSFYVEANDNDAWPERAFRFAGWEMVA